jgi:CHAT domain-containing protein
MALRMALAKGTASLGSALRERQELAERWQALDDRIAMVAAAAPDEAPGMPSRLRAQRAALERRLTELDARLAADAPRYSSDATLRPIALEGVQALLAEDEAVVAYLVGDAHLSGAEESWAWVVRPGGAWFVRLPAGEARLTAMVRRMRSNLTRRTPGRGFAAEGAEGSFDVGTARELYGILWAPLADHLGDVAHVLIVPDGPLESLPFAALVTRDAPSRASEAELRELPWLVEQHALTTLPSVGVLAALRRTAPPSRADRPFVGFGDPVLTAARSGVTGLGALRRLPETARELRAMASALSAAAADVHLGPNATEAAVRSAALEHYRVVAFSTHGLKAGELPGVAEPALVLTPPAHPSREDDGLLTTSEIAPLRMDADWVVLSACNTAADDGTPRGEGLSGLARAFFFAGSRAVVVSHWAVSSSATVELMTKLFDAVRQHHVAPAEALRRAMRAVRRDQKHPEYAHPYYWAPFVVAGAIPAAP